MAFEKGEKGRFVSPKKEVEVKKSAKKKIATAAKKPVKKK